MLKFIKDNESLKSVSWKFGKLPKTLRVHRDQLVKRPGHIHVGKTAVFSETFESDTSKLPHSTYGESSLRANIMGCMDTSL